MYAENIKGIPGYGMGKIFAGLGCRRIYHSAIHEFRKTGLSVDISTSGKRALTYPYTDQKGIKLAAGETLTVSCDDTYEV